MKANRIWLGLLVWASLFPGCGSGGSGNTNAAPALGCDQLATCCAGIKDAATKQTCTGALSAYRGLPNGDAACTAALPSYQAQCSGAGGSSGGSGGCDQLAKCCSSIQDATTKQQCSSTATAFKGVANGDATCAAVLPTYQTMCTGGAGGAGGASGGGCDQLAACCAGIQDATTKQQCLTSVATYKGMASGDVTCAAVLPSYQSLCKAGAGGSGGTSGGSCDKLVGCCNGMEPSSKQSCLNYVNTAKGTPNGDAACASALQGYESAKLCTSGTGGAAGTGGSGGAAGSAGKAGSGGSAGSGGGGQCLPGGASCQSYTECCSLVCDNQVCRSCAGSGQECEGTDECCSGMICYNDQCRSCRADNSSCTYASDCCSNICNGSVCEACRAVGDSCLGGKKCCSGLTCSEWGECLKPGPSCENAEDCGSVSTMVCDPHGYGCQPGQCSGSKKCSDGQVCLLQVDDVSVGACYDSCSPHQANTGCQAGMTCSTFWYDDSIGYCKMAGTGQPNASCTGSIVATGCTSGYDCFDDVCRKICNFFGSPTCPDNQYCSIDRVCSPDEDNAAIGESCSHADGWPCGPSGSKWEGLCLSGGCKKLCRLTQNSSDCGSGSSCIPYLNSDEVGTCQTN